MTIESVTLSCDVVVVSEIVIVPVSLSLYESDASEIPEVRREYCQEVTLFGARQTGSTYPVTEVTTVHLLCPGLRCAALKKLFDFDGNPRIKCCRHIIVVICVQSIDAVDFRKKG
jgi:hypothetical protein